MHKAVTGQPVAMTDANAGVGKALLWVHADGKRLSEWSLVLHQSLPVGGQDFPVTVGVIHVTVSAVHIQADIDNRSAVRRNAIIFMTVTFKSIRITFLCKGIGAVTDRKK